MAWLNDYDPPSRSVVTAEELTTSYSWPLPKPSDTSVPSGFCFGHIKRTPGLQ
jgi:hypothetical protein